MENGGRILSGILGGNVLLIMYLPCVNINQASAYIDMKHICTCAVNICVLMLFMHYIYYICIFKELDEYYTYISLVLNCQR